MKDNLFILIGPTAIGKTSLSIDLAKRLNGEIISADSMQIYKHMDIGTAKVTKEEMENIPHYLVDIIPPDEGFTVSDYKSKATMHINDINKRGKLPIVVGGTGLYINSLVYDLNFAGVSPNEEIRQKYESLANEFGNEYLHKKLLEVDRASGERLDVNNVQRIIRALEIYEVTGKTMTEQYKDFRVPIQDYNLVMVCLNMDRATLYERINQRVDIMIEEGLIEEVKSILDMGYSKNLVSLKAIGYKEIIMYLDGFISLEDAINLIKKGSRNYAKRQLTWFRRDDRIKWIDIDSFHDPDEMSSYIETLVKSNLINL